MLKFGNCNKSIILFSLCILYLYGSRLLCDGANIAIATSSSPKTMTRKVYVLCMETCRKYCENGFEKDIGGCFKCKCRILD
ncbi:unnamed protein product [Gordionus sp. m RMFG-2023]